MTYKSDKWKMVRQMILLYKDYEKMICISMITGRAQLIPSHSSTRFCFELGRKACNSNFGQNLDSDSEEAAHCSHGHLICCVH